MIADRVEPAFGAQFGLGEDSGARRVCRSWQRSSNRSWHRCCIVMLLAWIWAGGLLPAQELLRRTQPRWDLTVRLTAEGETAIETVDQWKVRRTEILEAMTSVMGTMPEHDPQIPVPWTLEEELDLGEVLRRKIRYRPDDESEVPAYLFLPKQALEPGARPVPAILCLHPTDDRLGNQVVIGLDSHPTMGYAKELAERGYVTLAPAYPLLADYQPDLESRPWVSGSIKAVWDNRRALDLLASIPCVDEDRFGAIGHSLGGHNAVYTAVWDERIDVVVSSCGLDAYVDYYDGDKGVWEIGKGWCSRRYMPKLAQYRDDLESIPYDFPELIGALAPRHVRIVAPLRDDNFRYRSVDRIVAAAAKVYELYGHAERLTVEHPDCPHDFPDESRQSAYRWIDEALGHHREP